MKAVAYSVFRDKLKKDDAVMNARNCESLLETARATANPYLSEKLDKGLEEIDAGEYERHSLIGA